MAANYTTTTNDPDILALVAEYKTARDEAHAATRHSMSVGISDFEASLDMHEKHLKLDMIQTRLCIWFVAALDRNKN